MVLIELEELCKSFNGQPVLRGLSLSIKQGETLVIMGQSGCGKSVLLKHIIGLIRPDRGRVMFAGKDLTHLSHRELNRERVRFGMLFQSAALFDSLTVGENVAFPLREHTRCSEGEISRRVADKLRLVGLEGIEDKWPGELSGGMKKRVGLARAIALDPEVILYDEPTAGIDPVLADDINELIVSTQKHMKATTVAVTHDVRSAFKVADRIALLHDGVIVEVGTPEEIRNPKTEMLAKFLEGARLD